MVQHSEIWSIVICLTGLGRALTWNHDEQFVDIDFPYFPYTDRFDGDGLTDARIRSSDFSGFKRAVRKGHRRKPFYNLREDSHSLIDATLPELDGPKCGNISSEFERAKHREKCQGRDAVDTSLRSGRRKEHCSPEQRLTSRGEHSISSSNSFPIMTPQDANKAEPANKENTQGKDETRKLVGTTSRKLRPASQQPAKVESHRTTKSHEGKELKSSTRNHQGKSCLNRRAGANVKVNPKTGKQILISAKSKKGKSFMGSYHARPQLKPLRCSTRHEKRMVDTIQTKAWELHTEHQRKRFRRNPEQKANPWKPHSSKAESPERYLWENGLPKNFNMLEYNPKNKVLREGKNGNKTRKITLVAPYENRFNAGGFRSTNPSSWLSKEIERFIRRKDHRWLDFMRNSGMDVKRNSTILSAAKRKSTKVKKTPAVDSLNLTTATTSTHNLAKQNTNALINSIDCLLADLNQFRSNVKNSWSSNDKKTRDLKTNKKLHNNNTADKRLSRMRRGIRIRRFPFTAQQQRTADILESDLRDLRRNLVASKARLPEEEMQALKDLKLHVKVYVEKGDCHR